jgi:hypothetical protein
VKLLGFAAVLVVVAIGSALGGYAFGRHTRAGAEERQTAAADALNVVSAYNNEGGSQFHVAAAPFRVAPHIYRSLIKRNGKHYYACVQTDTRRFWSGNNTAEKTDFHGVALMASPPCRRR